MASCLCFSACSSQNGTYADSEDCSVGNDTVYQVAQLHSLIQGYYDGVITVGELRKHGNIGVTTNAEMIASDVEVWKLNNFYDILCKDICDIIALSIFQKL